MAITEKIFTVEVADNENWDNFFPLGQNIYGLQSKNDYTGIADPDFELENIGFNTELTILSFSVKNIPYTKVTTVGEVATIEKTFYWDVDERLLRIHFEDHKPPAYFKKAEMEIGKTIGFFYTNSECEGVWNDQQYHKRLKSFPVFSDTKDDLYYSKQVFKAGTVVIDNQDLEFINFSIGNGVKSKYGNFVRVLEWSGDKAVDALYSEFNVKYQGLIEKVHEGPELKLGVRDIRTSLDIKSPAFYLDTADYQFIKDSNKEYVLPEAWGKCFSVPCVCLNQNVNKDIDVLIGSTATKYDFLICDTSTHRLASDSVKTIYINGTETNIVADIRYNEEQKFAYIKIDETNFRKTESGDDGLVDKISWDRMDKVSIDVYGYVETDGDLVITGGLIENAMYIMREIIRKNYGFPYTSTFFDTTTWTAFEDDTDVTYKVGWYVNKPITVQKQIEELAIGGCLGKFIWNPELKFSFDNDDFTSYESSITPESFLPENFFPSPTGDGTTAIAILRGGYKRKWSVKDKELGYEWLIDESNKDTASIDSSSTLEKDFLTVINNASDMALYNARVLTFGGIANERIPITVPWEFITLNSGEWIKVLADHSTRSILGWTSCQIQSVVPDPGTFTVKLDLRIFGYFKSIVDENGAYILNEDGKYILED